MKDYYKILGVDPSAEAEVISSAYRAMVRKYHPDTYKGADAEVKMKELNEAYELLNNHLKRTDYDRQRKSAGSSPPPSDNKEESDLKKCSYCAEMIKAEAIKCKHCGEMLDDTEQLKKKYGNTAAGPKAPSSSPSNSAVKVNVKDGAEMVLIPAGEFLMGSLEGEGNGNEHPQHIVYLDAYYIYKYEVTNEQFAQFVRETGYRAEGNWKKYAGWGKEKHPVVTVTWNDAMGYCRWAGGNLPTEAQWEKAARGTDGREYPWGNTWDGSRCNWYKGPMVAGMANMFKKRGTTPVGSFPYGASPYGTQDMVGSVCEWCADWYDENYYKSSPSRNPEGGKNGQSCITRGNSWGSDDTVHFRCAYRDEDPPDYSDYLIGFRVCRSSNTP